MYFISFIAIILVTIVMSFSFAAPFTTFLDLPSLLLLLIVCIPVLFSTGLQKDFCNAFRIGLSKNTTVSLTAIKRAHEAVSLMIKTLLYGSLLLFVLSCCIVLLTLEDIAYLGPNLSVSAICFVYATAFIVLLLPLKSILKVKIMEYMQE